jgi:hypothetical protein
LSKYFPHRLASDQLDWLDLRSAHVGKGDAYRQKRTARAILQRLFSTSPSPGVILADEVGMGKTYETFAVMAALFIAVPNARVAILTNSAEMALEWKNRWTQFLDQAILDPYSRKALAKVSKDLKHIKNAENIAGAKLGIGSFDSLKKVSKEDEGRILYGLFEGCGLHKKTRRTLARVVGLRYKKPRFGCRMSARDRNQFFKAHYDKQTSGWNSHKDDVRRAVRVLALKATRGRRRVDLLVVDEAHRLGSDLGQQFLDLVLLNRAHRALWVTATPFAMKIEDMIQKEPYQFAPDC